MTIFTRTPITESRGNLPVADRAAGADVLPVPADTSFNSMDRGGASASSGIYQAETQIHGTPPGVSRPLNNAVQNRSVKIRAATSKDWTDEQVLLLQSLAAQGLSGSQIASQFPGKTRNSIIGKIHRMQNKGSDINLGSTPKISVAANRRKNVRGGVVSKTRLKSRPLITIETPEHVEPLRLSLMELTASTCRWPIGDPKEADFSFCGIHSELSNYCPYHTHLAHRLREKEDA